MHLCPSFLPLFFSLPKSLVVFPQRLISNNAVVSAMQFLNGLFAEAKVAWLSSVSLCCPSLTSCAVAEERHRRGMLESSAPSSSHGLISRIDVEKPAAVLRDQPAQIPRPYAHPWEEPMGQAALPSLPVRRERAPRKSISSSVRSFSVRKHSKSYRGRPQISAPSNFRHVYSQSFQFPAHAQYQRQQAPASYRPLELSIYMPQNELSPILPHFVEGESGIAPPPPAYVRSEREEDDVFALSHQRSFSNMSFHLPRRGTHEDLSTTSGSDHIPSPPPKSKARMRAYTSPSVERIAERIATAIIEKEKLQKQIDDLVERQSIYASSRPSTAHGMLDLEPMPSIPALPPAVGLTFAERVSTPAPLVLDRPRTAPPPKTLTPVQIRTQVPMELSAPSPLRTPQDRTPPPPLPLVLRPPLRKKKSFSRVSNWLFPGEEHRRQGSVDSVTNLPRPVKEKEGFYQCMSPEAQRTSFDTVSSVSTWYTEEEPTAASTWTPGSPSSSRIANPEGPTLERVATFGRGYRKGSVGVAF